MDYTIEDKSNPRTNGLIQQLDEEDKNTVFKISKNAYYQNLKIFAKTLCFTK